MAIDPAVLKIGQQQFLVCGACHGPSGEGTALVPPLAGSEWVLGPVENLIRIQFRGLQGPIKVKGKEYSFPGGMQPMAYQTDEQIAGVLTYVRNSFGNNASVVTPAEVAALRGEVGKPQLTAAELVPPATAATVAGAPRSTKYDDLDHGLPISPWAALIVAVLALMVGFFVMVKIRND